MAAAAALKALKVIWAMPNSLIGLVLALIPLLAGGRATISAGTLEVTYRDGEAGCGRLARSLPFRAIVFGHVILAVTREELVTISAHERVHVRQYERWGPLFLPAYLLSGAWQWLNGRNAYFDNYFEVQAGEQS
ncbi:MAG TPA: signal peptide prediction [Ramlibacter sp.]|nr:signal peptide prediction [Ramlibacter sp.]